MKRMLTFFLLLGCTGEPARLPPLPSKPFSEVPNGLPIQLDRISATTTNHYTPQEPLDQMGQFSLQLKPISESNPLRAKYGTPLPFRTHINDKRFAPKDMVVYLGDEVIPYATGRSTVQKAGVGWKVHNKQLIVATTGQIPTVQVRIETPSLAHQIKQLSTFQSNYSLQDGDNTHSGLLLPQATAANWNVTLPPNAQFNAIVALQQLPIPTMAGDGGQISLHVEGSGPSEEVARITVSKETPKTWTVDLAKWQTQTVSLTLKAEPGDISKHDFFFVGAPVIADADPSFAPRRVIIIGLDTTRADAFGFSGHPRNTSPYLDRTVPDYTYFTQAWTPAPRTRPSFRSATTGRHPLQAVGARNLGDIFDAAGFATAGIVANIHLNPRFGFDRGFDYWSLNTKAKANDQVDQALTWLRHHQHRDTYLFLHIMDPHLFYDAPPEYQAKFTTGDDQGLPPRFNRQKVLKWMGEKSLTLPSKEEIRRRYDAEVAFTDDQLKRFISAVDQLTGQTLLVIHSDHGEEFWEHKGFEHNHTLYDEVTKAVFLVRPPSGESHKARSAMPATLADIAPTVLDYAQIQGETPFDGISLKPYIEGAAPIERPIGLGHLMYDKEQWGVVWANHKYILHTSTGEERLYHLEYDPDESNNIAMKTDLSPWVSALEKAHNTPVGPGWRIPVQSLSGVRTIPLPRAPRVVGVIDPEATISRRANQAWGETPIKRRKDIATVTLNDAKDALTITPRPQAKGIVFVLFDQPTPAPDDLGIPIKTGTVIATPAGEAERMRHTVPSSQAKDSELELLKTLGYITDD